jgi:hypothetical protein
VLAPLNITTHDFLVLLKEATDDDHPLPHRRELSIGRCSINGTSSSDDRGQEDGSPTTMNAAHAPAATTANNVVNEQLTAAESAVAQAQRRR